MAANILAASATVSLASLATWIKIEAACTLLAALDLLTLTVGQRRDPGNLRLKNASLDACKVLLSAGTLALVSIVIFLQFSQSSETGRYPDAIVFLVTVLTIVGWITAMATVLTLIGGVYALVKPTEAATGAHHDQPAPHAQAALTTATTPLEAQQETAHTAQEERASGPGLSPWIEAFVLLNIGDLAVRAAVLFVRGPHALPNAVTGNPSLSILVSFGGAVLYTAIVAGMSWVWYSSAPRLTRALLAVQTVLTVLAVVYEAMRLIVRK